MFKNFKVKWLVVKTLSYPINTWFIMHLFIMYKKTAIVRIPFRIKMVKEQ